MWRLVREELRFYGRTLLISWAFGIGIFLLVVTILAVVGSVHDQAELPRIATQVPLAILIASMVAAFIVTGTERGEGRVRLYAMLPLPISRVAFARVLFPVIFMLLGLAVSHVVFGALLAVPGGPYPWSRHLNVDFLALLFLVWVQAALAFRELIELGRRVRWGATLAPWTFLAALVALAVVVQIVEAGALARLALVAGLNAGLMALTYNLFVRRAQFTK
jgi:hypothetical protein